jgi:membrane protein insertase Oxa1/YidC/SpoIIIJ
LLILIATVMMQFVSFKLPTWLSNKRKGVTHIDEKTKKQMKKTQKIGNWMIVFFLIMSITIPTLLALYWMISGLFTLTTTWLQHIYISKKAEATKNGVEWHGPIDRTKMFFSKVFKKDNKEIVEVEAK